MVLRDRNHPSIVMWSLCNEGGCMEGDSKGQQVGDMFKSAILAHDKTRPITAAMNGGWGVGLSFVLDVQGINYNYGEYDSYRKTHPQQPLIGSETASCTCARSIYVTNDSTCHKDVYSADGCAQEWWTADATRDFVAGGFAWTGFDYKGEPTPYGWPDVNSNFGIIDLAGFPKDTFYYYQSWWTKKPVLHLLPHWNWQGKQGQPINVWAYTNANSVELFLNSNSLGSQTVPVRGHVQWRVPYQPGTLQAKAYDSNKMVIATETVETTGAPTSVSLSIEDGEGVLADGLDVAMLVAKITDSQGRVVPTATNGITFTVEGQGTLLGVGNGDPSCVESDKGNFRSAFGGLARVIVQSSRQPGIITVTASSTGLASGKASVTTR